MINVFNTAILIDVLFKINPFFPARAKRDVPLSSPNKKLDGIHQVIQQLNVIHMMPKLIREEQMQQLLTDLDLMLKNYNWRPTDYFKKYPEFYDKIMSSNIPNAQKVMLTKILKSDLPLASTMPPQPAGSSNVTSPTMTTNTTTATPTPYMSVNASVMPSDKKSNEVFSAMANGTTNTNSLTKDSTVPPPSSTLSAVGVQQQAVREIIQQLTMYKEGTKEINAPNMSRLKIELEAMQELFEWSASEWFAANADTYNKILNCNMDQELKTELINVIGIESQKSDMGKETSVKKETNHTMATHPGTSHGK